MNLNDKFELYRQKALEALKYQVEVYTKVDCFNSGTCENALG